MKKLVFDIGGTAIKYAIMNNDGEILEKGEIPTPRDSQETFLNVLADIALPLMEEIDGIAMSIPGNVDSATGFVHTPGALKYNRETPVAPRLQALIAAKSGKEIPVTLENDGKAAVLAESWKGNLQGVDDGAVIILGTGIGGGILLNGELVKGRDFFAGEFSFLETDFGSENPASLLAMNSSTSALVHGVEAALGNERGSMNGFAVFDELKAENPKAWEVFDQISTNIATQIYNLVCTLNPQRVLIGGGISKQPLVLENIRKKYELKRDNLKNHGLLIPDVEIDTTRFFNDSNLIGALYSHLLQNPAE